MIWGKTDDGYAQLFEQFGHKLTQIDAPITPNMPSFGLHIGVFEALTIKIMAQIGIALIEEIGATYAIQNSFGCFMNSVLSFSLRWV